MTETASPKAPGVRARVRAELTSAIKEAAKRQLVTDGAAGLSLRAIARELDMASSAIYRYFASRDDLLTALIIDAYNDVGQAVEAAEAACERSDVLGRWTASAVAFREWAIEHQHEYALIYGSPVPGYAAPEATIASATRVPTTLLQLLGEIDASAHVRSAASPAVINALAPLTELSAGTIAPERLAAGVAAWGQLLGLVTLELFGHLNNAITDYAAVFEHTMIELARDLLESE